MAVAFVMRPVAIFISLVVLLLLGAVGATIYVVMQAPPPPPPRTIVVPVEVEPAVIELGVVSQCEDPIAMSVRLVNTGDAAATLVQVIPACSCTVPDLRPRVRLEPGEAKEFMVTLDPWAAVGLHTQKVDFIYAEGPRAPSFRVMYEVPPGVRTVPGAGHRGTDPEAVIRVTADDRERFVIEGVEPRVVADWVRTPTSETHLSFDWALVDAAAKSHPERFEFAADGTWKHGIVTISLSRPDCPRLHVRVYNRKAPPAMSGLGPGSAPAEAEGP